MAIAIETLTQVNPENEWRLETPGSAGWARSVRPGSPNKYFMVSCDSHLGPPRGLFADRIEPRYRDRLPRMERDDKGVLWQIVDGARPTRILEQPLAGEDEYRTRAGTSGGLDEHTSDIERRLADMAHDGVDAELVFPNGAAIFGFWTADAEFSQAQMRVYNDWAAELLGGHRDRIKVAAGVATADVDSAIREVHRVARMGYEILLLPEKPIFGPSLPSHINYNLPMYDPLWAAIEETGMPITFHISTSGDPRGQKGPGGAVINYCVHALPPMISPVVNLCASGILDRFPKLRFATIEAGAGWVPWLLNAMDEAYRKHHMWVQPKLKHGLPSDYYRMHGASEVAEDVVAMELVEKFQLEDNLLWGNDYPHHEGTFPHSAEAIERQMAGISEKARAKILGLNAARLLGFRPPADHA